MGGTTQEGDTIKIELNKAKDGIELTPVKPKKKKTKKGEEEEHPEEEGS